MNEIMNFLSLLPIAIALSLDSFGVGVTYGARRLKVPLGSLGIITLCTGLSLVVAVLIGDLLVALLSKELTESIGGFLLVAIGLYAVINHFKSQLQRSPKPLDYHANPIERPDYHQPDHENLGVIPDILQDPMAADFDHSNSISLQEAFFLGLALSIDSFVAGVSIRLLGYSPWLIIFTIAMMSSIFLYIGIQIGILIAGHRWLKQLPYFPSTMLIVIGLHKIF